MTVDPTFLCPCCSGASYATCCYPFHTGALPQSALQLMRSRYSAYARQLPDYIMATTHPKNLRYQKDQAKWKKEILIFCQQTLFQGLDILAFIDGIDTSWVTFTAHLEQEGKDATFTEKSRFEKVGGKWLYLDGLFIKELRDK